MKAYAQNLRLKTKSELQAHPEEIHTVQVVIHTEKDQNRRKTSSSSRNSETDENERKRNENGKKETKVVTNVNVCMSMSRIFGTVHVFLMCSEALCLAIIRKKEFSILLSTLCASNSME